MTSKDVDNNPIVVSISCITYNHAPYIRQCLDGFMMQHTNFAFEVLIHDDASTDGTTEIIKEYETRYPDVIKPIYEEENQWVKGRRGSAVFNFPRARGKYIALCEGDDYWTDPLKLQKQVDFLESNINCSLCFHRVKVMYDNNIDGKDCFAPIEPGICTLDYMLENWVIPTCSVIFLRDIINRIPQNPKFKYSDNVLFLTCFSVGEVCCVDGVMGVYHRHDNGWTMDKNPMELMKMQYVHFHALLESFPMLDLSILHGRVLDMATHLLLFKYRSLLNDEKELIHYDLKNNFIGICRRIVQKCMKRFLSLFL